MHDIGLAAWFGGALMGAIGLNGAANEVTDASDRAKVAAAGWARRAPVNAGAIGAHLIGGIGFPSSDGSPAYRAPAERHPTPVVPDRVTIVARQRERFGGVKVGSAFFGWLTATGMAVLLIALLAAAGVAYGVATDTGVDQAAQESQNNTGTAQTVGLVGAITLLVVLLLAYYCGGYVAAGWPGSTASTSKRKANMNIDKDSTWTMLRSNGQDADADQTRHELPDRVDTDEHAGLLGKFGLNPAELIAKFIGGQGGRGGIGGALGKLL